MSTWREYYKLRLLLFVAILFLISLVQSCSELRYAVSGVTAEATVRSVKEAVVDTDLGTQVIVEFHFKDKADTFRVGKLALDLDEAVAVLPGPFDIVYIPSSPDTYRLPSQRSLFWPVVLGVMLLVGLGLVVWMHREATATGPYR